MSDQEARPDDFGKYLREAREARGVSLRELSTTTTSRRTLFEGAVLGVFSVGLMGYAIVLAKPALEASHLVEATLTRLVFGTAALLLWILIRPGTRKIVGVLRDPRAWRHLTAPSIVGAYFTMLLWIGGMKYTEASVSGVLCQLSTVFTLGFGALILHERLTVRHWVGGTLAMGSALIVVWLQGA